MVTILVLTIEAARAAGPVLAAYLPAHSAMINGSALCAALAVTERDRPCWPDCGQTDQNDAPMYVKAFFSVIWGIGGVWIC